MHTTVTQLGDANGGKDQADKTTPTENAGWLRGVLYIMTSGSIVFPTPCKALSSHSSSGERISSSQSYQKNRYKCEFVLLTWGKHDSEGEQKC